ncbi:PepSY domain-containing protein, partial [Salmonella enterica subsp. enterica]
MGVQQAVTAAQALYPQAIVSRVSFPRQPTDAYEIRLRQPGEVRQGSGATRLWLDAYTGARLGVRDPLAAPAGDT